MSRRRCSMQRARYFRRLYRDASAACVYLTRQKSELALALWGVKRKLEEAKRPVPAENLRVPFFERLRLAWRVLRG